MHFKIGVKKKNRKYQGEVTFAWFRDTWPVPLAKLFAQLCAQTNVMIFDVIPLNKYCLSINSSEKFEVLSIFVKLLWKFTNLCWKWTFDRKNHSRQAYYHFDPPSSRFNTRYAKVCFTSQKHDYLVIKHVTSPVLDIQNVGLHI